MSDKNEKKRGGRKFSKDVQPPNEAKRVKKGKTLIKEAIGLQSWDALQEYLLGKGIKKFIRSLESMDGKGYAINFLQAMEYFKPKLSRAEHTGKDGQDLNLTVTRTVITKKV